MDLRDRKTGQFLGLDGSRFKYGEGWEDGLFDLSRISLPERYEYLQVLGFTYATHASGEDKTSLSMDLIVNNNEELKFLGKRLARDDIFSHRKDPDNAKVDFYLRPRKDKESIMSVTYIEDMMPGKLNRKEAYARDRVRMRNPNFGYYRGDLLPSMGPKECESFLQGFMPPCVSKAVREENSLRVMFNTGNNMAYRNVGYVLSMANVAYIPTYREIYRIGNRTLRKRKDGAANQNNHKTLEEAMEEARKKKKIKLCPMYSFLLLDNRSIARYISDEFPSAARRVETMPEYDANSQLNFLSGVSTRRFFQSSKLEGRYGKNEYAELREIRDQMRSRLKKINYEIDENSATIEKLKCIMKKDATDITIERSYRRDRSSRARKRIKGIEESNTGLAVVRARIEDIYEDASDKLSSLREFDGFIEERSKKGRRYRAYMKNMEKSRRAEQM